jgi:hypothetical protein
LATSTAESTATRTSARWRATASLIPSPRKSDVVAVSLRRRDEERLLLRADSGEDGRGGDEVGELVVGESCEVGSSDALHRQAELLADVGVVRSWSPVITFSSIPSRCEAVGLAVILDEPVRRRLRCLNRSVLDLDGHASSEDRRGELVTHPCGTRPWLRPSTDAFVRISLMLRARNASTMVLRMIEQQVRPGEILDAPIHERLAWRTVRWPRIDIVTVLP